MHDANQMIERYLHQVAERIPERDREDVSAELRSLLMDSIEERAAGLDPDEETIAAVLRDFGPPEKVAARYVPEPRPLISGRLMPVFWFTAKLIPALLAGLFLFLYLLGMAFSGDNVRLADAFRLSNLAGLMYSLAGNIATNLGALVLIFAIVDRIIPLDQPKEWDPRKLPKVPAREKRDEVQVGWVAFKLYGILFLAWLFNSDPQGFAPILAFNGQNVVWVPLTALGVHIPVALLNIWWILAFALNVELVRVKRWTTSARVFELGIGIFGVVILYLSLNGPGLGVVDPEWLAAHNLPRNPALEKLAGQGTRLVGFMLAFGAVADLAVRAYRLGKMLLRPESTDSAGRRLSTGLL